MSDERYPYLHVFAPVDGPTVTCFVCGEGEGSTLHVPANSRRAGQYVDPGPRPDTVRVLRVVEYEGPRGWVEDTVARSIHGQRDMGGGRVIRAATVGNFPIVIPPPPAV